MTIIELIIIFCLLIALAVVVWAFIEVGKSYKEDSNDFPGKWDRN